MNISPDEAEEALNAIQAMMQKTRRAISNSGVYKFLILWGAIWFFGFLGSQFIPNQASSYIWIGLDVLGAILSALVGMRLSRNVRSTLPSTTGKRIAFFWLLLFVFCVVAAKIVWPIDAKQLTMLIVLFATLGWITMGLLLSFASVWWGLALLILSLVSYFAFPGVFYLLMAFLGGGGMVILGIYVKNRW